MSSKIFSKLFKAVLSGFKKDEPKKVKKAPIKAKAVKPMKKTLVKAKPISKPVKVGPKKPKSNHTNVQMPAPWSKVEKFKRIKKENWY